MGVALEIQRATVSATIPVDEQFQLWVELVTGHQEMRPRSDQYTLAIRIVDEQEGRRFNFQYRGKDYSTNVLSFPTDLPDGLPAEITRSQLGDLLMCAPVVAREAREQGKPEVDHWAHITIHGVLHLLGYVHERNVDAVFMEALETELLASLGIPGPYPEI